MHCSLQLRKKLGWSVQFLGGPDPLTPQWLRPCFPALVTPLVSVGSTANSQVSEDELPGGHPSVVHARHKARCVPITTPRCQLAPLLVGRAASRVETARPANVDHVCEQSGAICCHRQTGGHRRRKTKDYAPIVRDLSCLKQYNRCTRSISNVCRANLIMLLVTILFVPH